MPVGTAIKLRRDTAANWTSLNPVLRSGEPAYETDTGKLKIGDGVTAWNSLAYFAGSAGASAFTDLTDAPASYTGEAGKLVAVKGTEDGLEFIATPSSVHAGTATLATGTVAVPAAWVTALTVVTALRQAPASTAGKQLYCDPADHVVATSFTLKSEDATDTGAVFWMATEPTEPAATKAMKSDASGGDAWLDKLDLGSDFPELWLTFDMAFEQAALDFWTTSSFGSGVVGVLRNGAGSFIESPYLEGVSNPLAWTDNGLGGQVGTTPAPVASTWQTIELHYKRADAVNELYVDTTQVYTNTHSPSSSFDIRKIRLGQYGGNGDAAEVVYFKNVKCGTTRGGIEVFAEDFSGDLSAWDVNGACTIVPDPF